jgi:hypothetical protein
MGNTQVVVLRPYVCSECKQDCAGHWVDFGIGPYEFWGVVSVDKDEHYVSKCCDAEMDDA